MSARLVPCCEPGSLAVSQQIACLLWKPNTHYQVHKSLPHNPFINQIYPIHILIPCVLCLSILILSTICICISLNVFQPKFCTHFSSWSCSSPTEVVLDFLTLIIFREQVKSFKYLVSVVNGNNLIEEEIKERISLGNRATMQIKIYLKVNY